MKLLYTTLFLAVFTSGNIFSQSEKNVKTELIEYSLKKKEFTFIIEPSPSIEEINNTSRYYTEYFSTTYNIDKGQISIKIIKDEDVSYKIITRFLISNNIKNFNYKNETYKSEDFYSIIKK